MLRNFWNLKYDTSIRNRFVSFPGGSIDNKKPTYTAFWELMLNVRLGNPLHVPKPLFWDMLSRPRMGPVISRLMLLWILLPNAHSNFAAPPFIGTLRIHGPIFTIRISLLSRSIIFWTIYPTELLWIQMFRTTALPWPRQITDRFLPGILWDSSTDINRARRVIFNKCLDGSVRTEISTTLIFWDIWELWITTFSITSRPK